MHMTYVYIPIHIFPYFPDIPHVFHAMFVMMIWPSGSLRMGSHRAWFGGRLAGVDDAFAGAEDAVPDCDSEVVSTELNFDGLRGYWLSELSW